MVFGAILSLAGSVALPLGSGFAVGFLTRDEIKGWYAGIKKPSWNPPNWLFGPAWSFFYTSMGVASWVVVRQKGNRAVPLTLYGAQLALNLAWTPLFFKAHKLDIALADSLALLGVATAAAVKMGERRPAAVWPLMAPYLAWVAFATTLNAELLRLNPEEAALDYAELRDKLNKLTKRTKDDTSAATKDATAKVTAVAADAGKKAADMAHDAGEVVAAKTSEVAAAASTAAASAVSGASDAVSQLKEAAAETAAAAAEALSSRTAQQS